MVCVHVHVHMCTYVVRLHVHVCVCDVCACVLCASVHVCGAGRHTGSGRETRRLEARGNRSGLWLGPQKGCPQAQQPVASVLGFVSQVGVGVEDSRARGQSSSCSLFLPPISWLGQRARVVNVWRGPRRGAGACVPRAAAHLLLHQGKALPGHRHPETHPPALPALLAPSVPLESSPRHPCTGGGVGGGGGRPLLPQPLSSTLSAWAAFRPPFREHGCILLDALPLEGLGGLE